MDCGCSTTLMASYHLSPWSDCPLNAGPNWLVEFFISLAAPHVVHYSSSMSTLQTDPPGALEKREAESLRELTPQQWKSGVAAWLGWFFDGLDMHIYTIVAAPFVAHLIGAASTTEEAVKDKSSWIQ